MSDSAALWKYRHGRAGVSHFGYGCGAFVLRACARRPAAVPPGPAARPAASRSNWEANTSGGYGGHQLLTSSYGKPTIVARQPVRLRIQQVGRTDLQRAVVEHRTLEYGYSSNARLNAVQAFRTCGAAVSPNRSARHRVERLVDAGSRRATEPVGHLQVRRRIAAEAPRQHHAVHTRVGQVATMLRDQIEYGQVGKRGEFPGRVELHLGGRFQPGLFGPVPVLRRPRSRVRRPTRNTRRPPT